MIENQRAGRDVSHHSIVGSELVIAFPYYTRLHAALFLRWGLPVRAWVVQARRIVHRAVEPRHRRKEGKTPRRPWGWPSGLCCRGGAAPAHEESGGPALGSPPPPVPRQGAWPPPPSGAGAPATPAGGRQAGASDRPAPPCYGAPAPPGASRHPDPPRTAGGAAGGAHCREWTARKRRAANARRPSVSATAPRRPTLRPCQCRGGAWRVRPSFARRRGPAPGCRPPAAPACRPAPGRGTRVSSPPWRQAEPQGALTGGGPGRHHAPAPRPSPRPDPRRDGPRREIPGPRWAGPIGRPRRARCGPRLAAMGLCTWRRLIGPLARAGRRLLMAPRRGDGRDRHCPHHRLAGCRAPVGRGPRRASCRAVRVRPGGRRGHIPRASRRGPTGARA